MRMKSGNDDCRIGDPHPTNSIPVVPGVLHTVTRVGATRLHESVEQVSGLERDEPDVWMLACCEPARFQRRPHIVRWAKAATTSRPCRRRGGLWKHRSTCPISQLELSTRRKRTRKMN